MLTTNTPGVLKQWTTTGAILTLHRWLAVMGLRIVASVAVFVVCLQFGATRIEMSTVVAAILNMLQTNEIDAAGLGTSGVIMVQIRFPRVLMGFLVGSSLAGVCVTLQATLRNPIAAPYVLGVSS